MASKLKLSLLVLFGLLPCGMSLLARAAIPRAERDVLISIYLGTNGDGWTQNTNWCKGACPLSGIPKFNKPGTECTWFGVRCFTDESHVQGLYLESRQLTGQLPSLVDLTQLQDLYFPNNNLSGPIPAVAAITSLEFIDLSFNQFTGSVPDFSGMLNLDSVNLDNNLLSGTIAPLVNAPQLQSLWLSNNRLTGSIPTFAGLYDLSFITVDNNQFTGPVPDLSQLNVGMFFADHNQLTGVLPPPGGDMLTRYSARICPNPLSLAPTPYDQEWDFATAQTPWWGPAGAGCDHIFSDPLGG
jgi:hypothetical protein